MERLKGVGYAILSSATFGLIPLFSIPLLQSGMSTMSVIFYRLSFAAVMMGLVGVVTKIDFRVGFVNLLSVSGFGLLYIVTATVLLVSYRFISSGLATTLHFLYPIVVSFAMVVFFKQRLSRTVLLSALMSVVGVALLCLGSGSEFNLIGMLIALATAFSYGFYIICVNHSQVAKIDSVIFTFYVLLSGALLVFPLVIGFSQLKPISSSAQWLNLIFLALLSTVISNLGLVKAVKLVGSTTTAILGSMEPLTAVMVGTFVFGEFFGFRSMIGLVLVLFSVVIVIRRKK